MSSRKIKRCGRKIELWEKSLRVYSHPSQKEYFSQVIYLNEQPNDKIIEQLCDFADSAYKAGYQAAKDEFKKWLNS